jgi:UV DNA damage endonuclease
MRRLGYCCISLGINQGKHKRDHISVNRTMVKRTFDSKGLDYVSELAIQNIDDCKKILKYNLSKGIKLYRMSSDMFAFMGLYEFKDLPRFSIIKFLLSDLGNYIKDNDIRVSFHPGPFDVLASENPQVVEKSIIDLNRHAEILDMMDLPASPYYPINIHINTTKSCRETASQRFVTNFSRLSDSCKSRLTIENDDSPNQYSVKMLYDLIYCNIGIPIVFDQHHFNYGPQDQSMEDALKLACSTWYTVPITHMSSSRRLEDNKSVPTAHADYIYEKIQTFGLKFDIEIEAKAKDLAVFKYIKDFSIE